MRKPASVVTLALILVGIPFLALNTRSAAGENSLLLEMSVSKSRIIVGETIDITLKLRNVGSTPVTVTFGPPLFDAFYCTSDGCFHWSDDKCFIQVVDLKLTLGPRESYSETLNWNLYQYRGTYLPPKPGTYELLGMCRAAGLICAVTVIVTWNPADINGDCVISIYDAILAAAAYDATPSDPHWNPLCDIAEPYNKIDIFDLVKLAGSYGAAWLG